MESINEGKRNKYSKILIIISTVLVISMLAPIASIPINASSPTIWTDKEDYKPEETVIIYGEGFKGNSEIRISVTRPDNVVDSWTVTSEPDGGFITKYLLDGITGTYHVIAADGENIATTTFTDSDEWTTELFGWDRVSNSWVSGNLAGYPEGDLVGFKFIITNKQNVPAEVPQINSFYDYFNEGKNAVGIDAEVMWKYAKGPRSSIDFTSRFPPANYISITPDVYNEFFKYQGGVRQNYYQFDAGRFGTLEPGETLIIYFQAHLAETAYWKTVMTPIDPDESGPKQPVPGPHNGAASFPGASLQVGLALVYTGTKTETQSIPVAYAPGNISGYKFNDLDGDGSDMESGEPGLEGWTITLDGYDEVGHHIVLQTTTTSTGSYNFSELPLGTFNIIETLKPGWTQTYPQTGIHYNVKITEEQRIITGKNFGNFELGNISGYKWDDIDGDGVWDVGEPFLEGWTIKLYNGSQLVATTTTNEYGYYEFTGLNPGQYTISEELQAGWTQTYPSSGTHTVIITSGANIQNKSFGNFKNVEIRACKYEDKTSDGLTTDDTPLSGWTIKLYRNSQLIDTETTGSDGCYEWSDLGPGNYSIEEVVPQGWTNTSPTTHDFGTAQSGGSYEHKFTNFEFGRVSGYKWNDLDKDGVWGAGEPALNNWTIVLYRGSVAVASVVTDISGYYEFVGLSAGSYGVCEVLIEGWMQTYPGGVGCHNVTITSGMNLEDLNFGNKELLKFLKTFSDSGSLSGYVKPVIVDPITSDVSQIKTGPGIWWEITYFVENKDSEGHYYILWDKWGGNLMVLNSTPIAFNQSTKLLTLADGVSFKIDYSGYSAYLGTGLTLNPSKGTAIATLHKGDQQQGTNPGKGKGTTNDGKAYDVDIRWEIGWLNPGESATLKIYLAPGQNPGGQLQFSSWGTYVINTGPRVRAYLDLDGDGNPYENNEFQYSWDFTNQLTVNVYPK